MTTSSAWTTAAIIATFIAATAAYSCNTTDDCEWLGTCSDHVCVCKPGFEGPSCGTLKLGQAPNPNLGIWPLAGSHEDNSTHSWGFTIVKPLNSSQDNTYHGWVNTGCYDNGNESIGIVTGTFLLHVTSTSPTGPFTAQDIMIPPTSFNPHMIYSQRMKQYLMFFRINGLNEGLPMCLGNETLSKWTMRDALSSTVNNLTADTMDIAVSESPYGPWYVDVVTIANMPGTHISNPSAIQLENGTFVMAYRFNTNNEYVGVAVSESTDYKGPYHNIANLSVPAEDPFLWKDANDGSYHMVFHVMNAQHHSQWPSLHAWSLDLYHWNVSNSFVLFGQGAYPTNVTWTDGTVTTFYRRERPEIMFDENGKPMYLYTSAEEMTTPNETSYPFTYTVAQAILP